MAWYDSVLTKECEFDDPTCVELARNVYRDKVGRLLERVQYSGL